MESIYQTPSQIFMYMKSLVPYYVFVCLFLWASCTSKLPKKPSWETLFVEADKEYYKGKYDKAQAYVANAKKAIRKNYEDRASIKAWANVYEAQIAQAKADFKGMEVQIQAAQNALEVNKDADLEYYVVGVCRIADIHKNIGNWRKMIEILTPLQKLTAEKNLDNAWLTAEIAHRLVTALVYTEHYEDVQKTLPALLVTYNELQNPPAVGKKNALLPAQKLYRAEQLARLYVLKAEVLRMHGDYKLADSTLTAHEPIIKKLALNTPAMACYLACKGDINFDNEVYDKAKNNYRAARNTCAGENQDYLKITEKLAHTYIRLEEEGNAKREIANIKRIGTLYAKKDNIYTLLSKILDAEDLLFFNDYNNEDIKQTEKARTELMEVITAPDDVLPNDHPFLIKIWEQLYESYVRGSTPKWSLAEKALLAIIDIAPKIYGDDTFYKNFYLTKLGNSYLTYSDNFDKGREIMAKKPYQLLLEKRSPSHCDYLSLNNSVVNYYDIIDDYKNAMPLAEKAVEVQRAKYGEKDITYGRQLIRLAQLQVKTGNYKQADQNTQIALKIIRKEASKNSNEYAEALAGMAKIYGIMGSYEEAEELLGDSQRIYDKIGINDVTQKAKSVEEMAFLYVRIGKYAETEEILNQIIAKKEKRYGKESHNLVNPLNQLSNLYLIKGDYTNGEKTATRARIIAQKIYGEDNLRAAESYHLLARYNKEIGDLDRAKEWLNKVIHIQEAHLGLNHVELGHSYMELAVVRFQQSKKNFAEAYTLIDKAKRIMHTNFDDKHPLYAEVLKAEGELLLQEKNYEKALQVLKIANQIWLDKLERRNINSASVYSLIGDIYAKMKKFDEAKEHYTKAEVIYRKVLSIQNPEYVKNQSKLGRMFFVKGDLKRANELLEQTTDANLKFIKTYFPALSEREKTRYWAKIRTDFEFYNSLAIKQKDSRPELLEKIYNFRLATKAILLSSSIKVRQTILNGKDEDLKDKFKLWLKKKEELTALLSLNEAQIAENNVKPEQLLDEINTLEKNLSEQSDAFATSFEADTYTWEQVRETLKDNEAAVEVIRYRPYEDGFTNKIAYALLVVTPKTRKNPKLVLLEEGNDLEGKYLRNYSTRIKSESRDRESYKRYWQPLEAELNNATVVYFSPDGVYNQINPESFFINANADTSEETYLIDKTNVRLVSNTKDLIISAKQREAEKAGKKKGKNKIDSNANKNAVLFGDPEFYASVAREHAVKNHESEKENEIYIAPLPGTEVEIKEIKPLLINKGFKVFSYTKREAIENELKTMTAPRILHIATHGFFDQNKNEDESDELSSIIATQQDPLRKSGILAVNAGELLGKTNNNYDLEDGIFTAIEAMNMELNGTDVVFLSACETGLGEVAEGEGVYGLQRAFLVAGAQAVIMSLFKVNDEATAKLAIRFYTKFLATGDKRKAFNDAQREIKLEYKKPIYWGAFTMIGVE